jgi:hypothetical protein
MQLNHSLLCILFEDDPPSTDFRSELIKLTFLLHRLVVTVVVVVVVVVNTSCFL